MTNSNTFQGDERDIILLSLVTARKADEEKFKSIALTKQMYYQRFNVAASRAKDKMILFHSITNSEISNKDCVRFKILGLFENFEKKHKTFEHNIQNLTSELETEIY
ncbi:AAA domain-containing protein [Mollicutes bacterium LVI A0039]|nr:AAA domain-containing protein [Mollicutes bacterium LVI A0039]